MKRVAITGIGILSPLGRGKAATLGALRSGRSGIGPIRRFDASSLQCRIAGEVPAAEESAAARTHDRFTGLALLAAEEAAAQAGPLSLPPDRIGVVIGTGMGGTETLDASYRRYYAQKSRIPPLAIPMSMYNAAPAAISTRFSARGLSYSVVSACASSAQAIGLAVDAIRAGRADAVFAGGADAPLTPGMVSAWESLRVLAVDNAHPEEACRPFSADRKGLVLAEGAAVLLLESFDLALARGATILGEIAGHGSTSDAAHITDPSAEGAARAMELALEDAGLERGQIGYINAHGTGTRANDPAEAAAIRRVFGDTAPPVSSTKSAHGHAMGASGAIEIVCSMLAARAGFLPATLNLRDADPACELDHVANTPRPARINAFLSNSFGFGGMNAVVAVTLPD